MLVLNLPFKALMFLTLMRPSLVLFLVLWLKLVKDFLKVRCRLALLPFLISCLIWLDLVASLPLIKERILVIILINGHIKFNLTIPLQQLNGLETLVIIMVANKYAFLQITRRRFLNEWEAFKKVISRRNIRRRITILLTLSNLKLLRRITRTENILHRNFTRRQVAIQNRVASNIGISQSTFSVKVLNLFSRSRRKTNKRKSKHSAMLRNKETRRSEERFSRNAETDLVCRLLLEKKKATANTNATA